MQAILAYHPEILVADGDKRLVIIGTVPEFDSDTNILKNLGRALKVRTVRDIVWRIMDGSVNGLDIIDGSRRCTCIRKRDSDCQGRSKCNNMDFRCKPTIDIDTVCESL